MRTVSFSIEGEIKTSILITENADGTLTFDISVDPSSTLTGDLRALFFDLEGVDADTLRIAAEGADVTDYDSGEASVDNLGGGANIKGAVVNELGSFDVGVEFGTSGVSKDDIQSTSFILSSLDVPLSLDMLNFADFGIRYTSVGTDGGTRSDSLKLGDTGTGVNKDDFLDATENAVASVNLFANDQYGGASGFAVTAIDGLTETTPGIFSGNLVSTGGDLVGLDLGIITIDASTGLATLSASADALAAGMTATAALTYTTTASDGSTATATLTLLIQGTNDAATISGVASGSVKEDSVLSTGGVLTVSDKDAGEAFFVAQAGSAGNYGTFSIDLNGTWSYAVDNTLGAVQSLAVGQTLTETFTVTSLDSTASQDVTVTIKGTNDAPVATNDTATASLEAAPIAADTTGFSLNSENGHYYKYVSGSYTWQQASAAAAAMGGHLVTITSQQENDFVTGLLGGVFTNYAWLGGQDVEPNVWRWTEGPETGQQFWQGTASGSASTGAYENWRTGEPNARAGETVVHMYGDGTWNDWIPSAQIGFVVEISESSAPAPVSGDVSLNDSDIDNGAVLTYALVDPVAGLTMNGDGTWSFDPSDPSYGSAYTGDTIVAQYTVTDEHGATDTATLTITLEGRDAPPPASQPTANLVTFSPYAHLFPSAQATVYAGLYDSNGDGLSDAATAQETIADTSDIHPWYFGYGDIDGDGDMDFGLSDWRTGLRVTDGPTVPSEESVLINLGDTDGDGLPEFERVILQGAPDPGYAMKFADLNGDGLLDVIRGDRFANGTDPNQPATDGYYLNLGDTNGDGVVEFSSLQILQGQSYINWRGDLTPVIGGPTNLIETGDFNGDGIMDILMHEASGGSPALRFSYGQGDTDGDGVLEFTTQAFAYTNGGRYFHGIQGMAVGDMDGDGDLDVMVANEAAYTDPRFGDPSKTSVVIMTNNGTLANGQTDWRIENVAGALTQDPVTGEGRFFNRDMELVDIDGDGDLDFITTSNGGTRQGEYIQIGFNEGDTDNDGVTDFTVDTPFTFNLGGASLNSAGLTSGDFDDDGDVDLIFFNTSNSATGAYLVENLGDIDGDGYVDFAQGQLLAGASSAWDGVLLTDTEFGIV